MTQKANKKFDKKHKKENNKRLIDVKESKKRKKEGQKTKLVKNKR